MVHLALATVDSTDPNNHSITIPCPSVTPNSKIYFWQFTSPFDNNTYWSTRFPITGADGQLTDPEHATQPNGAPTPWGTGALIEPTLAVAAPSDAPGKAADATGVTTTQSSTSATDSATTSGTQVSTASTSPTAGANAGSKSTSSSAGTATNANDKASKTSVASTTTSTGAATAMSHAPVYVLGAIGVVAAFAL
jgi:cobalamin biosynthesis Mg chelatase CobN